MTLLILILSILAALYGLAVLCYILVLRWLAWDTTTQSNGYTTNLLRSWTRCHKMMDNDTTNKGGRP